MLRIALSTCILTGGLVVSSYSSPTAPIAAPLEKANAISGEIAVPAEYALNEQQHAAVLPVSMTAPVDQDATETAEEQPELSPEVLQLRGKLQDVLAYYRTKHLNTRDHSPWEVMHSLIAYGVDTQLRLHDPNGQQVSAIGWLCFNGRARGVNLFYPSGNGIAGAIGPGLQGHPGQFLGMLAQSNVVADYPIKVGGKNYTVMDLVASEQASCQPNSELTFKLIGLSHYLDSDAEWTNQSGQKWNIPRLIHEELAQPIRGATCGGTHRLFGFSYAVRKREKRGQPLVGEWARASQFINDYHEYTFKLQNPDGSFSTEWFAGRGNREDLARKLQTTGHILEWLAFSLPEEELLQPRTMKAVNFLATTLQEGKNRDWSIGPQGHALHALMIYHQRVFQPTRDTQIPVALARELGIAIDEDTVGGSYGRILKHADSAQLHSVPELSGH